MAPSTPDDLEAYIADRDRRERGFRALHMAAPSRGEMTRHLIAIRTESNKTQTELGALVGTSQAQIARLEKADSDARISSLERYAAALGLELRYTLVPTRRPPAAARSRRAS